MARSKRGDDPEENHDALWRSLSPNVGVGAVFLLRDDQVNPASAGGKRHPYAIISGSPLPDDPPRLALGRTVQLSLRTSFKVDEHGPMPTTLEEQDAFSYMGGIFSPAGELPSLDLPGVFTNWQCTIRVRDLANGAFVGWLPKDRIDRLTFRMRRPLPGLPYPPVGRV